MIFSHENILGVKVEALTCGDYTCEFIDGTRSCYYFERKSLADTFGTLGKGYVRFRKELLRAKENNIKLILIIEGSVSDILQGYQYSILEGISILRKLFTLWLKYDLCPVFVNNRTEMQIYIIEFYLALSRKHLKENRKQLK